MLTWDELASLVRAHQEANRSSKALQGQQTDLKKARRLRQHPLLWPLPVRVDLSRPEERLIVYGTLKPGGPYHYLLADLEATWARCTIRGRLGNYRGYPFFKWNPAGEPHAAWLVTSSGLPAKFRELDAFEGKHYTRRFIPAEMGDRLVIAYIYEGKVKA